MKKNVSYTVTITFSSAVVTTAIGKVDIPYYLGKGNTDRFSFGKKQIKFEARRSVLYDIHDIMYKPTNTINSQIIKSLMLYYLNADNFPRLRKIDVAVIVPNQPMTVYTHSSSSLKAILNQNIQRKANLHFKSDNTIWDETTLGYVARIASSCWLEAINTDNLHLKFNRLWIAFNALFAYFGNSKREIDNLSYIREQIKANENLFPLSKGQVSHYSSDYLRSCFRWGLICKADISRGVNRLCESILHYEDSRILDVFREVTSSGSIHQAIQASGRGVEVENKLLTAGVNCDIDLVILLCIKYSYFMRNRRQHGQVIDYSFTLGESPEDKELAILNSILEVFLYEFLVNVGSFVPKP